MDSYPVGRASHMGRPPNLERARQSSHQTLSIGMSLARPLMHIYSRIPGYQVTPYYDKDADYYSQFHIIIYGLDFV
jgi:hypothetical protein